MAGFGDAVRSDWRSTGTCLIRVLNIGSPLVFHQYTHTNTDTLMNMQSIPIPILIPHTNNLDKYSYRYQTSIPNTDTMLEIHTVTDTYISHFLPIPDGIPMITLIFIPYKDFSIMLLLI